MTTVDTGLHFELAVKRRLEQSLAGGLFGIAAASALVHHRKAYPSAERRGSIVVDLSVEIFRHTATEPFLIWIWECKNYKRPIPIDDVEEFHAKLQQIGSDRTKGTIVASTSFQASSLAYAQTHGIGLVRLIQRRAFAFVLESGTTLTEAEIAELVTTDDCSVTHTDAVGCTLDAAFVAGFDILVRRPYARR
jgi:hypothetical protein